MTCFWDGIRSKLNINVDNISLIRELKDKNQKITNIYWNNSQLTSQQADENYIHIKDFNENNIYNGYDCSVCDPFLILISILYNVNVIHNYNGHNMHYNNPLASRSIHFGSDRGHFW